MDVEYFQMKVWQAGTCLRLLMCIQRDFRMQFMGRMQGVRCNDWFHNTLYTLVATPPCLAHRMA